MDYSLNLEGTECIANYFLICLFHFHWFSFSLVLFKDPIFIVLFLGTSIGFLKVKDELPCCEFFRKKLHHLQQS